MSELLSYGGQQGYSGELTSLREIKQRLAAIEQLLKERADTVNYKVIFDKAVTEKLAAIEQLLGQFNYRSESTAKTFLERMAALEQGQGVLCERLDGLRDHVIDVAGRQGVEQAEIAALEKQAELTIEVTRSKVEGLQKNLNHRCDDLSGQNANILQQVELVKVWVTPKRPGKPKPRRKRK